MKKALLALVLATVTVLAKDKRPVVAKVCATTVVVQPATIYTTTEQTPSGTITRVYARKGVTKDNSTGVPVTRYGDPQFMGSHFVPSKDVASLRNGDHVWGDGILPANVQPVTMEKFVWADPSPPPQVTYVTVNSGYSYYPYYHTSYGRDWYGGGGYVRGGYVHGGRTYYGGQGPRGGYVGGGNGPRGGSVGGGATYRGSGHH